MTTNMAQRLQMACASRLPRYGCMGTADLETNVLQVTPSFVILIRGRQFPSVCATCRNPNETHAGRIVKAGYGAETGILSMRFI